MGFGYSSDEMNQDWRYAIAQDWTTPDGEPFPYADNGRQQWGDEVKKLPLITPSLCSPSASSDGALLAVAVGKDVHVYDTATWEAVSVLRGHEHPVESVCFKPGDDNILVSGQTDGEEPTIIVWDIAKAADTRALGETALRHVGIAAAHGASAKLAELGVKLSQEELQSLGTLLEPLVGQTVRKGLSRGQVQLHGRLLDHRGSQMFSPSGAWLTYLPGNAPRANREVPWDIVVCPADSFRAEDGVTLRGHTDLIVWTGWSRDESLFASVAWDQTTRVWDAKTWQQKHKFTTEGQNWTGGFSPDGRYLATTCGGRATTLSVHSLADGTTHWVFEPETGGWMRSLDWHPDSNRLAVGGEGYGKLYLLDVAGKKVVQKRLLSAEAARPRAEEIRKSLGAWLEVYDVRFFDGGNKLAAWTASDGSAEVYDLARQVKWRFARGGTEDGPRAEAWRDAEGKVTSKGGYAMLVWEKTSTGEHMLAGVDGDGIRIWKME